MHAVSYRLFKIIVNYKWPFIKLLIYLRNEFLQRFPEGHYLISLLKVIFLNFLFISSQIMTPNSRGIFKTRANICDKLKAVNYVSKKVPS